MPTECNATLFEFATKRWRWHRLAQLVERCVPSCGGSGWPAPLVVSVSIAVYPVSGPGDRDAGGARLPIAI